MQVKCPRCQTSVEWKAQAVYRPFCSKQCQLIDLGEWTNEEKTIPVEPLKHEQQMAEMDPEEIEAMLSQQSQDFFCN